MKLIVADTGPVNYLVLTGCVQVLPGLPENLIAQALERDRRRHELAAEQISPSPDAMTDGARREG